MFCTKCGFNNPDGTRFCIRCGNSMEVPASASSQPSVQQAQAPQRSVTPATAPQTPPPAYAGGGNTPVYSAPVNKAGGSVNEIAKTAGSVLFLIGVICFTIPVILSLIGAFSGGSSLRAILIPLLQQTGASGSVLQSIMQSAGILSAIGVIPSLVVTAGLWIIFASAKSSGENSISRAGFIMIKVITIINMIATIILFVILLIFMILAAAGVGTLSGYNSRLASSGVGIMIALIVVLIAVMVLVIIYYSKLNRMLGSMSKAIRKGSGKPFVSKFVMVFTFISALGALVTIISSVSSYELYRNFGIALPVSSNILSILPNVFNAAACVIFGIIMAKARGKRYGSVPDTGIAQPVYGPSGNQSVAARAVPPQQFSQPQAAPQQYAQYVPPVVPPFQSAPQPEPAQYTPPVQNIQPEPFAQAPQPEEPVFEKPVFNEPEPEAAVAQPVFEQPAPEPVFEQPVQEAPQYSEPVFEQPAAEPVQYTQPAPEQFVQPDPVNYNNYQEDTFGSTVILKENLPQEEPVPEPRLTRATTGEFVRISKSNFLIGKDPNRNDYTISGNSAISRQHAEITFDGTDYYIVDHNSSNHVYINGGIIKPELFYPIEDGDIIKLADEDFTFSIK